MFVSPSESVGGRGPIGWRRIALVVVMACGSAGASRAQGPSPITAVGKGVLEKVSPTDGEMLAVELKMRNVTPGPVRITRAEAFLTCQGGWSASMGEMISTDTKFFGNEPVLTPGDYAYKLGYGYSTPISHYLLALQLSRPGQPPHDYLLQVPFVRQGFATPPSLHAAAPVFIGLQEPIEVLTMADGESWLQVVGQVVNTSGKPLTLKRHSNSASRTAAGKAVIDRDLTKVYRLEGSKESVNEFFFGFRPPKEFRKGTLHIDAEFDLGGRRLPIAHEVEVERIEAHLVRSPVGGRWSWGNGPGELDFHTHYHYPEQRYSYDMGVLGGARHETSAGDPNRNTSYFCWDKPIYCVEDGKVAIVVNDVPDNDGHKANPASEPVRNACVWVEHPDHHFSCYYHLRKGSATVKVGQPVKAGDVLGRVGNAGISSEPHLHFGYLGLDRTGRFRNIPVRIEGLKTVDGKPADGGVPKGRVEYDSPRLAR